MEYEFKQQIYIEDEVVKVLLEECDGILFVHVDVKTTLTPNIVKYMRDLWLLLQNDAKDNGFDDIFVLTDNHKFVKLIDKNFETVKQVTPQQEEEFYPNKLYQKEL